MRQTVRFREAVVSLPDIQSLQKRQSEGWTLTALEWSREVEVQGVTIAPSPQEVPYGLRISGDCWHLEEDATEIAVLTEIMEMLLQDRSLSRVADELNLRGHRMRDGAQWDPVSIFNLLPRIVEVGPRIFSEDDWQIRRKRLYKLVK